VSEPSLMLYPMAYGCGLANALNKTADKIGQGKHLLSEPLEQDQRRRGHIQMQRTAPVRSNGVLMSLS